ncbi:hypothetical protein BJV85_002068 [Clostridium acetobutylicum]|nr:hypothetical protein [Clostridium acetobutylicum]ADZ20977.1 hypothetical protein CEA_G1940 [Clostridium acetobutylicum EA 2018]AEI32064.1 hypothetical protein SMB_G1954 [Clostridium acetobutylicum DSM 1731]PSM07642.1 hypothetical protein C7T89_06120 [Clostridium sp. NJ4]AWV79681.1 hypothetical protein DK921_06120 [Clostridium acetobutylicum]MBC2394343.1 hypothetical protein [Clostridium acetobutylicum]
MNKKDAAKILESIKKGKWNTGSNSFEALEVAIRCLKGQNSKAKGGRAAKKKGANGEREWASKCREQGYENVIRGQQFCGLNGDADVIGLPYIHSEVKRVENLNLYDAMAQSIRDKKENEIPIVAHRKNNCDWLVTMQYENWFKLYREWEGEKNGFRKASPRNPK